MRDSPISLKAQQFTESVIREMTRLAMEHDAINLAQGFPDFAAPSEVKDAAVRAICADVNQYAITWGAREFRRAIAERFRKDSELEIDPEREITVSCGAGPRFVRLRPPDWTFDRGELARTFSEWTRAVVLNTPNNPTGKVFTR